MPLSYPDQIAATPRPVIPQHQPGGFLGFATWPEFAAATYATSALQDMVDERRWTAIHERHRYLRDLRLGRRPPKLPVQHALRRWKQAKAALRLRLERRRAERTALPTPAREAAHA